MFVEKYTTAEYPWLMAVLLNKVPYRVSIIFIDQNADVLFIL